MIDEQPPSKLLPWVIGFALITLNLAAIFARTQFIWCLSALVYAGLAAGLVAGLWCIWRAAVAFYREMTEHYRDEASVLVRKANQ